MYLKKRGGIGVGANLILGYLSATINLFFTMPIEVCNTRQMTGFSEGGIVTIMMELVKSQGLAGLYTGILANLLLCLNPAIKHAVFDQVARDCVCTSGWQHLWAPLCTSLRPVPAASVLRPSHCRRRVIMIDSRVDKD
mmetsp:Transcript_38220/g.61599  ORF Transcript_38220/g.61599 Transcript_38220/m.61599 type:complete len:138 (+) Transcript_38220:360-773(+)